MTQAPRDCMMSAMARNLGTGLRRAHVSVAGAPAAVRSTRPSWRDPRLWVGVALVAVSVLVGVRIVSGADRTVGVWAAAGDLAPGTPVSQHDLQVRRVHFGSGGTGAYLTADKPVPPGLTALREVGGGELLPRSALGPASLAGTVQVPVAVEPAQVPRSVARGSVVDVYVVGSGAEASASKAALSGVSVVDAPPLADSFGSSGKKQLVLAVPHEQVPAFFGLLQSVQQPTITVVQLAS